MKKSEVGAKKVKGAQGKPDDCKAKKTCPCNAFLQCSGRNPYGSDVWSDPEKKEKAMKGIAYNGRDKIKKRKRKELIAVFNKKYHKYNEFYENLKTMVNDKEARVLVMPEINDTYITNQMRLLASELHNKAAFSSFQKSMVLRANLVKNGSFMMSDIYVDESGDVEYPPNKMVSNSGGYTSDQWSVDHLKVRSKGGCNRFCNAATLTLADNCVGKNDNGPGCPCVDPKKQGESTVDNQAEFQYPDSSKDNEAFDKNGKKKPAYKLYECSTLWIDKNGEADNLPDSPPGTMLLYPKICHLDDPRYWDESMKRKIAGEVEKICK